MLKIDTEGHELEVLLGLGKRIKDTQYVLIEFHRDKIYYNYKPKKIHNYLVKNNLYGSQCVLEAESEKKSKFADQLKLLQNNVKTLDNGSLNTGGSGGSNGYNSIFSDPDLFNNSIGGDAKK